MDDITLSEVDEAIWHARLALDEATYNRYLEIRYAMQTAPCAPPPAHAGVPAGRPFDHGADWAIG